MIIFERIDIMIEIIGNFNTAKCFATTLEDGAREQIKQVCDTLHTLARSKRITF